MKFAKIIVAALLSAMLPFMLSLPLTNVSAYEFPNSFWAVDDSYNAALAAGDDYGIITYGTQSVSLMESLPQNDDTMGVMGSRTYEVIKAYERLGDFDSAVTYLNKYIYCSEYFGWDDGITLSNAKILAYPSTLDLYTLTDEPVIYYGAKNEPVSGTYFGQVSEQSEDRDSMTLAYQEYGDTSTLNWLDRVMLAGAEASGTPVELALNFPGEGNLLDSIISDTDFINRFCDILGAHTQIPIFLRIGAEVNVWTARADAEKYITAFRKIADLSKKANPNIAIVWSVSHASPIDLDMDDYYPGDEYVDWVGISAYAVKYFQGKDWSLDDIHNEIYFKAGDGADPVRMVEEVVRKYGDRKPIMLAECGSARYTRGEVNTESEEWARQNMLRMYSTVPMAYPQVKLIAYFNKATPYEAQDYDMISSPAMKKTFNSITSMPWFIQSGKSSAKSFKKVENTLYASGNTLEFYALPYTFRNQEPRVDYYIDGVWAGAAINLPYSSYLDLSGVSSGSHTLEAVVTSNGTEKIRKSYQLVKDLSGSSDDIFPDIASLTDTQKSAAEYVYENGIVTGYEDGTFRPYGSITRAEFATMICRAFGYTTKKNCTFSDASSHWASAYIKACVDKGAINGIGNNLFAPEENITFEQAAKILSVCAGFTDGVGVNYPDGFIAAGNKHNMFDYVSDKTIGSVLTRIDAAAMFYGALK